MVIGGEQESLVSGHLEGLKSQFSWAYSASPNPQLIAASLCSFALGTLTLLRSFSVDSLQYATFPVIFSMLHTHACCNTCFLKVQKNAELQPITRGEPKKNFSPNLHQLKMIVPR